MKKLLILIIFFSVSLANAQCGTCDPGSLCDPNTGECYTNGGPPPPGLDVPIDKEIPFAILAGFVIGGAYIYKQRGSKIIPKSF